MKIENDHEISWSFFSKDISKSLYKLSYNISEDSAYFTIHLNCSII